MSQILFDKLFDQMRKQFGNMFESSFVSFSSVGIKINIDEAIDYLNKLIDDTNDNEDREKGIQSNNYLTLAVCYFAIALLNRFEENQDSELEAEENKGN